MAKVVFFTHGKLEDVSTFEYYAQDVEALRRCGHEVIVCTSIFRLPLKFDVLFIWWWTHALFPVLFAKLIGAYTIITGTFNLKFPDGFEGLDYFHRPYWQRFLIRAATVLADLNLCVNSQELDGLKKLFGAGNYRYYPHVVSDDYLAGSIKEEVPTILNIAWSGKRNLHRKGVYDLIESISILRDRGVFVRVTLAGMVGDGAESLKNLIIKLELEDRITYLGYLSREEKIRLLRTSSIYVQPSRFEGFGLAIAEAMGCGSCVITCDVGAVRTVVDETGIYVPPASPESIATAIELVLGDSSLRELYALKAYERANAEFSFAKKISNLVDIFKNIKT